MIGSALEFLAHIILLTIEKTGYAGIFLFMFLESANVPFPSEVTMPFAGFLAAQGRFNFLLVVLVGATANVAGSLFSYWLAVKWGRVALLLMERLRLMRERDFQQGKKWVQKYGQSAAFFSRLLPIVRTFISFPAGLFRLELKRFTALTFAGSFVWSFVLTYVGLRAGEHWDMLSPYFHRFNLAFAAALAVMLVWWVYRHVRKEDLPHNDSDLTL